MKHLLSGVALAALLVGTAPAMAQGTDTGQIGPGTSKGSPGSTVTPQSTINGSSDNGIPPNSTLDPTGTSSTTGVMRNGTAGTSTGTGKVTDSGQIGPGVSKGSPGSTVSGRNANGIPPNSSMDPTGTSSTMGNHRTGASTAGTTTSPYNTTGSSSDVSRSTGTAGAGSSAAVSTPGNSGASTGAAASNSSGQKPGNVNRKSQVMERGAAPTGSSGMSGSSMMDHHAGMNGHHRMTHGSSSSAAMNRGSRGSDNATTEDLNRQELSRIEQGGSASGSTTTR